MKEEELETMRKSFDTVKNRSSKLESSKIDRLEKRVKEIAENSINNMDSLREIAIDSFKRNGIDVFCASDAEECQNIIYDLVKNSNSKAIAKAMKTRRSSSLKSKAIIVSLILRTSSALIRSER